MRLLREELQLLQEPGSYVGEVVKVMGKTKVLVKVHPEGKYGEWGRRRAAPRPPGRGCTARSSPTRLLATAAGSRRAGPPGPRPLGRCTSRAFR